MHPESGLCWKVLSLVSPGQLQTAAIIPPKVSPLSMGHHSLLGFKEENWADMETSVIYTSSVEVIESQPMMYLSTQSI